MLKVTATVSAIYEGLQALGCTILEEDVNAIEALVLMLEESSIVELSNNNGMIFMSFDLDIRADTEALAAFVKTEEALNFDVFVNDIPSVFNPTFNNVILKKAIAMSTNKSAIDLQAQLTQAIAASNAATAEACKVTAAFMSAIEHAKAMADQTAKANEANATAANATAAQAAKDSETSAAAVKAMAAQAAKDSETSAAAVKAAIEAMAAQSKAATDKLEAATQAATAQAAKSADRATTMADAINAQRKAAAQADTGPAWYTSTPAKAVGAVAAVAAVAAAGYYGWKAYSAE